MDRDDKKKGKKRVKATSLSEESTKLNENQKKRLEKDIRTDLIYVVKKRINSGFYKKAPVIEDIVDYFAKIFDTPQ